MDNCYRLTPGDEKIRYEQHNNSPDSPGYLEWLNLFLDFAFLQPPPPGCSVLDFGSGPEPVLADLMTQRGCNVSIEDPFFAPGERPGKFDLVTSLEVFEHLNNPYEILCRLGRRLKRDGTLCISTLFLPESLEDFEPWHYRNDSTHIGFFTVDGLIRAARRAGFIPERCDGIRYISFRLAHPGASC
jgi:2-polyprenyl-3-methyl-5-hydroxy-6-metoxy-1,4-benzoquinol methylase